MWIISSHEVEQAKERLAGRRAEIEARYEAEKSALDAESAAIETLERIAAEFAARNTREEPAAAAPPADAPPAGADHTGGDDPGEDAADIADGGLPVLSAPGPIGGEEASGLDIVKPSSRWRFNRAARPSSPEEAADGPSATSW